MSISVANLTKRFSGQAAVNDVSFAVPHGALFCVVGPSGCGKSTLLRLIAGLETPDAGTITLDGDLVASADQFTAPEDRRVGVVFQSYALWPHMTVLQNVAFPDEAQGVPRAQATKHAAAHLKTVALEDFAQRKPQALSGGQRQRVALARCLAGDARTILMDEPLANLDPHLRETMETELRAFHDRAGVTTLFITHDQREAMALADVMAVMEAGQILQIGAPQEIYARPANASVARFIGRGTLIPAVVTEDQADICGQSLSLAQAPDGPCQLFVRPEQIEVSARGWPCTVTQIHFRGTGWEGEVRGAGLDTPVKINMSSAAQVGDTLHLTFKEAWPLPA